MNDDDDSSMSRSFCPGGDKPSCDDSVAHPAATYNRHWQWTHTTPNCLRPWSLTFDLFYPRLQPHITVLDGHQDSSFYYPPIRVTCEKNLYEQRVFWILQLFIFGLFKERKKSASILGYKNHKKIVKAVPAKPKYIRTHLLLLTRMTHSHTLLFVWSPCHVKARFLIFIGSKENLTCLIVFVHRWMV